MGDTETTKAAPLMIRHTCCGALRRARVALIASVGGIAALALPTAHAGYVAYTFESTIDQVATGGPVSGEPTIPPPFPLALPAPFSTPFAALGTSISGFVTINESAQDLSPVPETGTYSGLANVPFFSVSLL